MNRLKNKKGFSLVELIIVVAVMVALVAVMAPSYTRYVQKARDVVVTQAAEDVLTFIKTEYRTGQIESLDGHALGLSGEGLVKVGAKDGFLDVTFDKNPGQEGLDYMNDGGATGIEAFKVACGVDANKPCRSELVYIISVSFDEISSHPVIEEATTRASEGIEGA